MLERRYAGQLDERGEEYIAFAVDGAKRMQALINDLLAFSRVGRSSARASASTVDELVAQAHERLSRDRGGRRHRRGAAALPEVSGEPRAARRSSSRT